MNSIRDHTNIDVYKEASMEKPRILCKIKVTPHLGRHCSVNQNGHSAEKILHGQIENHQRMSLQRFEVRVEDWFIKARSRTSGG